MDVRQQSGYEDLSAYRLSAAGEAELLARQTECAFIWSNSAGHPVGVIMNYVFRDGRFWLTASGQRARVAAVRRDPRVSVAVSSRGSGIATAKSLTCKGRCVIHQDDATKAWFYPALAAAVRPGDGDAQAAFARHLDSPRRVILEVVPESRIGFDSTQMWRDTPSAVPNLPGPSAAARQELAHRAGHRRVAFCPHDLEPPLPDAPPLRGADQLIGVAAGDDEVVAAGGPSPYVLGLEVAAGFGAVAVEADDDVRDEVLRRRHRRQRLAAGVLDRLVPVARRLVHVVGVGVRSEAARERRPVAAVEGQSVAVAELGDLLLVLYCVQFWHPLPPGHRDGPRHAVDGGSISFRTRWKCWTPGSFRPNT